MLCSFNSIAQNDSLTLAYKLERCNSGFKAQEIFDYLEQKHFTKRQILEMGTYISYHGNDKCGNELMNLCISKIDTVTAGNWHSYSVQNTKHGNYAEAIQALEKSLAINAKEMEGYFGWLLLYYYRDYENALKYYQQSLPSTQDAGDKWGEAGCLDGWPQRINRQRTDAEGHRQSHARDT